MHKKKKQVKLTITAGVRVQRKVRDYVKLCYSLSSDINEIDRGYHLKKYDTNQTKQRCVNSLILNSSELYYNDKNKARFTHTYSMYSLDNLTRRRVRRVSNLA